jgi:formylglycine-generating enzyme required for sulfatase activity
MIIKEQINGIKYKMVSIKGGAFMMGCPDWGYEDDAKPEHMVTVLDYMLGETVVTKALWSAVMDDVVTSNKRDLHYPKVDVSWDEAQVFIEKLNALLGIEYRKYRLPTEAEWEFAARGGTVNKKYVYDGVEDDWMHNRGNKPYAWALEQGPLQQSGKNQLGLYDMSANVSEWCQDWYKEYTVDGVINPDVPGTTQCRVIRGGNCAGSSLGYRATRRGLCKPDEKKYHIGFRLAR